MVGFQNAVQSGGGGGNTAKVFYLGEGTSFNLQQLLPDYWQDLTDTNFVIAGVSAAYTRTDSLPQYGSSYNAYAYATGITLAHSYDSTTGILTVTGNTQDITLNLYNAGKTAKQTMVCKVYVIIGEIFVPYNP